MRIAEISVNRSEHHKVAMHVGAWEIPILQYEHSPEKVVVEGFKRLEGREYPDAQREFERLTQRFGIDTESGAPKTALVYGQGQMGVMNLRTLIEQERKAEDAEGDSLPVLNLTHNVVELPAAPTPAAPAPATEVIPVRPTLGLPKSKEAVA